MKRNALAFEDGRLLVRRFPLDDRLPHAGLQAGFRNTVIVATGVAVDERLVVVGSEVAPADLVKEKARPHRSL